MLQSMCTCALCLYVFYILPHIEKSEVLLLVLFTGSILFQISYLDWISYFKGGISFQILTITISLLILGDFSLIVHIYCFFFSHMGPIFPVLLLGDKGNVHLSLSKIWRTQKWIIHIKDLCTWLFDKNSRKCKDKNSWWCLVFLFCFVWQRYLETLQVLLGHFILSKPYFPLEWH